MKIKQLIPLYLKGIVIIDNYYFNVNTITRILTSEKALVIKLLFGHFNNIFLRFGSKEEYFHTLWDLTSDLDKKLVMDSIDYSNNLTQQKEEPDPDLTTFGSEDTFLLISKISSKKTGETKTTKAMEIPRVGCVVQVDTKQLNPDGSYAIAQAVTFVPNAGIKTIRDREGSVMGRTLICWN